MDFIGGALLIALIASFISSVILSIPIYFIFFLLLQLFLRKLKQIARKEIRKSFTIAEILKKSFILSVIATVFLPVSVLPYLFHVTRYQLGAVPTTYPYAKITNVTSDVDQDRAVINFYISVVKSGQYSVFGEFPCYKQIAPSTQEDEYPIILTANQATLLSFSFILDEQFRNTRLCKNKFFELRLSPKEANLLGDDIFVIFTGYLERIKSAGANAERDHTPYVYIPQFYFNPVK